MQKIVTIVFWREIIVAISRQMRTVIKDKHFQFDRNLFLDINDPQEGLLIHVAILGYLKALGYLTSGKWGK